MIRKNIQQALLASFMIAILSFTAYGVTTSNFFTTVLPNMVIIIVITLIATWGVDKVYELRERKKNAKHR